MSPTDKPLVWLKTEIKSPPFSKEARIEAGYLLRLIQQGHTLGMPHTRKLPDLCPRCYELRIRDKDKWYRIIFRIDSDAIILVHVFEKKSNKITKSVLDTCRKRIKQYDKDSKS
jgi:phage-related protein